jgi:broad specificity phosphatase PhoE
MSTTTLILARHGATNSNLQQPYTLQGCKLDTDLTPLGRLQAQALAKFLTDHPVRHVYCSPLRRAMQTAQLVADAHRLPLEVVTGLTECDIGQWEGLSWTAIAERWPREEKRFREDAEQCGYLGGENLGQVRDRVLPVIHELVERQPSDALVVVSHNVVNRVLLAHWLGIPLRFARRLPQNNGGHSLVVFRARAGRVQTINVASYLKDLLSS